MPSSVHISPVAWLRGGACGLWGLGADLGGEAEAGGACTRGVAVGVVVVPMPGHARGRSGLCRKQLSRSALPSHQTLVGGSLGNGNGPRNR